MIKKLEAYNTWHVTTEGDCEGKSTRNLGVHTGFIDEIAFAIADQSYYGLHFKPVDLELLKNKAPTAQKVQISIGIFPAGLYADAKTRVAEFKELLKGRNVLVKDGKSYNCVELQAGNSAEAQASIKKQILVNSARAKLTQAEREALGME